MSNAPFRRRLAVAAGTAVLLSGSLFFYLSAFNPSEHESRMVSGRPAKVKTPENSREGRNKGRAEYFLELTKDPATDEIPYNIRERELDFSEQLPTKEDIAKRRNDQLTNILRWVEAGPNDVGGRTRAFGIDIRNSNILLAGGVSGGIWRSTNMGVSWSKVTARDGNLTISSLAQDPNNPDTWYASMGEYAGGSARARGGSASYFGSGIYKSTDNGLTWTYLQKVNELFPASWNSIYHFTSKIKVSPSDGKVYLAANAQGLYASSDGGITFADSIFGNQRNAHRWTDFDFSSDGKLAVYLSNGFLPENMERTPGFYVRETATSAFINITPADFPSTPERGVLAFAPSAPNVFYAMIETTGNNDIMFYKFEKVGGTWTAQNRTANLPAFTTDAGQLNSQGGYNMAIAVKPDDQNFVIIGLTNLYRSKNGFSVKQTVLSENWIGGYRASNSQTYAGYSNHHPDQHIIVFDPLNPDRVWSGHDGGLSVTASSSSATAAPLVWSRRVNGYNVTQFYTAAVPAAATDNSIMGGTQDNGTPYFEFSGNGTVDSQDISSGDGSYGHFGSKFIYVSTQNGEVSQYTYETESWANVKPVDATGQLFIHPFAVHPTDDTRMIYPSGRDIFYHDQLAVTSNKNALWQQISLTTLEMPVSYRFTTVAFASNTVAYLAAQSSASSASNPQPPKFVRYNPAAGTYTVQNFPLVVANAYPHDIAVNAANDQEILVVFSNYNIAGIFHSTDGGTTVTSVEGNLTGNSQNPGPSIRSAQIMRRTDGVTEYYVGTSTGLYSTTLLNGASTVWAREGTAEIGTSIVEAIAGRNSDGRIVAATHGRGIFVGNVNVSVANEASLRAEEFALLGNYPNPFNPSTSISFSIPESGVVTLSVFDLNGRKVATPVNGLRPAGRQEARFDASGLSSGVYVYRLAGKWGVVTRKMTLVK